MKKIVLLMLLFGIIGLAGCGGNPSPSDTAEPSGASDGDDSLIRTDNEGLVTVTVKDGKAGLSFDLDKWIELHDEILTISPDVSDISQLGKGPFEIAGLSGKVKDACVGKVGVLDNHDYKNFVFPAVMLLMEDGSLEYTLADPLSGDLISSAGKLPWLKNIVSLSYEQKGEGLGDMTIYADDADGLRYDTGLLGGFMNVFDYDWVAELGNDACCTLSFSENGEVTLGAGWIGSEITDSYPGTYTIYLAENAADGQRPGVISFAFPTFKSGTYFFEADAYYLKLWISDGDPFCVDDGGSAVESYEFWQPSLHMGYEDESGAVG